MPSLLSFAPSPDQLASPSSSALACATVSLPDRARHALEKRLRFPVGRLGVDDLESMRTLLDRHPRHEGLAALIRAIERHGAIYARFV